MTILLTSMPGTDTTSPIMAPAVLKACLVEAGFKANAIDLNFEVNQLIKDHPERDKFYKFFCNQDINDEIYGLLEFCEKRILEYNPTTVCLSLLTQDSQFFTLWFCYYFKSQHPDIKILIGGNGIKCFIVQDAINFSEMLMSKGYIDGYINGDAEVSIVEYFLGNLGNPGINMKQWTQLKDLSNLPYPDFEDYTLTSTIPICDSRGCVQKCEFCDVIEYWNKFVFRSAGNIWTEIQAQINKYGIKHFSFHSSLVNGNLREFTKLLDYMCEYNASNEHQMSWDGYFIIRNQKTHTDEMWRKIKQSNGKLQLGIESVVPHIRKGLGKTFSNEDIDTHIEALQKHKIPVLLLIIIDYPTETAADKEYIKQWFMDRKRYVSPLIGVHASTAAVLPNTRLYRNKEKYQIKMGELPTAWSKPDWTLNNRIQYNTELQELLCELGFTPTVHNDGEFDENRAGN